MAPRRRISPERRAAPTFRDVQQLFQPASYDHVVGYFKERLGCRVVPAARAPAKSAGFDVACGAPDIVCGAPSATVAGDVEEVDSSDKQGPSIVGAACGAGGCARHLATEHEARLPAAAAEPGAGSRATGQPNSGWVGIGARSLGSMDWLGGDCVPPPMPAPGHQLKVLLFIDWDDTLCPTTWLEDSHLLEDDVEVPVAARQKLAEHARAVTQLLQTAQCLGHVMVVTLADRPWFQDSVRHFMPEATQVAELDVYFAREDAQHEAPPCAGASATAKWRAMHRAVDTLRARLGAGVAWESLVSIGDSDAEMQAARNLGRDLHMEGAVKWAKTVKMMENPDIVQLTAQVRALDGRLADLVAYQGQQHIAGEDLVPPERLVGLKGSNKILW